MLTVSHVRIGTRFGVDAADKCVCVCHRSAHRWLAIPLGATLVNNAQRRAAERAQAEAEERARQQNPFADMFRSRASAGGAGSRGGWMGGAGMQADRTQAWHSQSVLATLPCHVCRACTAYV